QHRKGGGTDQQRGPEPDVQRPIRIEHLVPGHGRRGTADRRGHHPPHSPHRTALNSCWGKGASNVVAPPLSLYFAHRRAVLRPSSPLNDQTQQPAHAEEGLISRETVGRVAGLLK